MRQAGVPSVWWPPPAAAQAVWCVQTSSSDESAVWHSPVRWEEKRRGVRKGKWRRGKGKE